MALPLLIPALAPIVSRIVGNLFPDKEAQAKAEAETLKALLAHQHELEHAAARVVHAEAASQHWLAANWRPLTMLTFVSLIVARWFGFSAPELHESEYVRLWSIVELGLGGYVIGRSVEKVAPVVMDSWRQRS
ncbi:MAG: hypothetical protein EA406_13625 [Rhodospirillales bacterium]|nr:MAG: hypothetical protein EA406_13625 [Rhodospirillales bacterium]